MGFGVGGDRDFEGMKRLEASDKLCGSGIAVRVGDEFAACDWRIAAQRDDVADAGLPIGVGDLGNLGLARLDTGQVRGGGDAGFAGDARDGGVGAFPRRAACAIGDRDEARIEGAEHFYRRPQRLVHLVGLGREEFEADADVTRQVCEHRAGGGAACFGNLRNGVGHAAAFLKVGSVLASLRRRPSQILTVSSPPVSASLVSSSSPAEANQPRICASEKPRRA